MLRYLRSIISHHVPMFNILLSGVLIGMDLFCSFLIPRFPPLRSSPNLLSSSRDRWRSSSLLFLLFRSAAPLLYPLTLLCFTLFAIFSYIFFRLLISTSVLTVVVALAASPSLHSRSSFGSCHFLLPRSATQVFHLVFEHFFFDHCLWIFLY